jgi:hypothetical protein
MIKGQAGQVHHEVLAVSGMHQKCGAFADANRAEMIRLIDVYVNVK